MRVEVVANDGHFFCRIMTTKPQSPSFDRLVVFRATLSGSSVTPARLGDLHRMDVLTTHGPFRFGIRTRRTGSFVVTIV